MSTLAASLPQSGSVPPTAPRFAESIERAYVLAQRQGHGLVTAEHLLFALTEDADALRLLEASRVDVHRVQADVLSHLTRIHEELAQLAATRPEGPRPAPDMLNALRLAAQVAQSSRRPTIDGALALTVLVADGRSVAAGILRGLGLTSEPPPPASAPQSAPISEPLRAGPKTQPAATDALLLAARQRLQAAGIGVGTPQTAPPTQISQSVPASPQTAPPQVSQPVAAPVMAAPKQPPRPAAPPPLPQFRPPPPPPPPPPPLDQPSPQPVTLADVHSEMNYAQSVGGAGQPPSRFLDNGETYPLPAPPADAFPHAQMPPAPALQTTHPNFAAEPRFEPDLHHQPLHQLAPSQLSATPQFEPMAHEPFAQAYPVPQSSQQFVPEQPMQRFEQAAEFTNAYPPAGAPYPGMTEPRASASDEDYAPIPLPIQPTAMLDLKQLVRALPRKLQRGKVETFELAIPREALLQLVPGAFDDAYPLRPEIFASRAVAARLIAPATGLAVEPLSPETVWIGPEMTTGRRVSDDDVLTWRWHLVGRLRGTHKVQLSVTARLIGPDGLAADTPFPVQTVEVVVVRNPIRLATRIGIAAALLTAGTIAGLVVSGRFGRVLSLFG